jgi:protein TonB
MATPASLPVVASGGGMRLVALLALSFVAHAAAFSWQLWDAPRPMASIGEVSVSVDLVLGGKEDAGRSPERGVAEASSVAAAAQEPEPTPEQTTTELAKSEPAKQIAPEPPTQIAPAEIRATPPETVSADITPREPAQEEKRRDAERGERTEAPVTTVAAQAAGGAGRGRSDADSNYIGRLSAHLARHQRFPAEARRRGAHGTATVAFSFDEKGRVTAVALHKSSGAAILDQEATAMVRRASPFPLPAGGGGRSFTVPVHFKFKNATSPSR